MAFALGNRPGVLEKMNAALTGEGVDDLFHPSLVIVTAGAAANRDEAVAMATVAGLVSRFAALHRSVPESGADAAPRVLYGDRALARVFALLAEYPRCGGLPLMARAIRTMAEGAMVDLAARFAGEQTEADYVSRMGRLSAAFTAACCQLGGQVARARPGTLNALWRAGYALGLARAAAEEVQGWLAWMKGCGSAPRLGEGVLGLPEIYMLQDKIHGPLLAAVLAARRLAEGDLRAVARGLMACGGLERARAFVRKQLVQAQHALDDAAANCRLAEMIRV